ncbi:MAG: RNA polymerase sigma factor SigZ [Nitrospirae bacterium]|nr:RNA polymerase sigma factor SigZ [Nitrospirota bacterium]
MEQETVRVRNEFHQGLRAFIARRVSSPADVEDILQDVFLRIHKNIATVKRPGRLAAWIFQVTRNVIADHYRAIGKRKEIPLGLSAENPTGVNETRISVAEAGSVSKSPQRELSACLRPMIKRLPEHYREAVILVELEGMTGNAAAERLGLSVSGVKSRVQRGRTKLKEMLTVCCHIELDPRRGIADYEPRDLTCRLCDP